jgi:hypothetical protein
VKSVKFETEVITNIPADSLNVKHGDDAKTDLFPTHATYLEINSVQKKFKQNKNNKVVIRALD